MKKIYIVIIMLSLAIIINAQYTTEPENIEFGKPKIIQTLHEGSYEYSVKEIPIKSIKSEVDDGEYFIEAVSSISVKKNNIIVQEIILEDESDSIQISIEKSVFKSIFKKVLMVNFKWNHYTTMPIGYNGYALYAIGKNDKLLTRVFSWFEHCGAQDRPDAELINFNIDDRIIRLDYEYYELVGSPQYGYGTFSIFYQINQTGKKIEFSKIVSKVFRKSKFINDHDYKSILIDPSGLIHLTKEYLNEKFIESLMKYNFIYE